MNWKKFALAALAALLLVPAQSGGTQAEELTGTLKKIKDTGIITVGHRESSVPFSYYDLQQNVVGYAQDYSDKVVAAVKKKLNMPNLKVRYVPITSQNRIPLLQNGTFDFECGSTTNNRERQQQVDFSNTFFIVGTRLLVDKNSGIKDFDDLKGKNVAVTAGTTSEKLLNKMNDEKSWVSISSASKTTVMPSVRWNRAAPWPSSSTTPCWPASAPRPKTPPNGPSLARPKAMKPTAAWCARGMPPSRNWWTTSLPKCSFPAWRKSLISVGSCSPSRPRG